MTIKVKNGVPVWVRRRWARAAALGTASALALSLAACSTEGNPGDVTINIPLVTGSGAQTALTQIARDFEEENPGIKVNVEFLNNNGGSDIVAARLAAGAVDITQGSTGYANSVVPAEQWVLDGGGTDSQWIQEVRAGQWLDLSDEPFIDRYDQGAIDALRVDGGVYVVPISQQLSSGVFYNVDLFEQAGVEVPTTYSEFVDVVDTLQAAGVLPFAIGGKDVWPASIAVLGPMNALYPTREAQLDLSERLWTGETDFDSPEMVAVMEQVKMIYDNADPNFAGIEYTTAQGQFANGQAAMTLDGTWGAETYLTANPDLNLGYFAYPGSENAEQNAHFGGRLDTAFAIPVNAPHPNEAKKFIEYFSTPDVYEYFIQVSGTIPTQPNVQASEILAAVQPALANPFITAWDWTFNQHAEGTISETGFNYKNLAPMGSLQTPEEAQQATQEEWAAALRLN